MSILEGAYWISSRKYRKYLKADADGTVCGVDPGPRGIDILDSTPLRTRIWLIEKATDGRSFRLRNYETGFALDIKDGNANDEYPVITTCGSTDSQLWSIDLQKNTNNLTYQIQNVTTSAALDQTETNEGHLMIISSPWKSCGDQVWVVEPVLLPDLYQLTDPTTNYILTAPGYPNASDGISGRLVLSPSGSMLPTRSQLWTFEYTSLDESLIRSALHHQFAIDLASDMKSVIAQRQHRGISQRWVMKDMDPTKHIVSLTNANTNTQLISREHKLFGAHEIYTVSTALNDKVGWQIRTSSQPPIFWITIQNSGGAFLAQADDRSIVLSRGALHSNDHAVQWRFLMIGNDLRYVIVNRATGFVLGCDYTEALASTYSGTIYPRAKDEDRNNTSNQWVLDVSGDGFTAIVHVESKYALKVATSGSYNYLSCASYTPGSGVGPSSWAFMPVYDNLPSFALISPLSGRCLAYNPNPEIGTISALDDVNDFRSQWLFYNPSFVYNDLNPKYVLLNKVSGNTLERFTTTRAEAHNYYDSKSASQSWKITPLYGEMVAVSDSSTRYFLSDFAQSDGGTNSSPHSDCSSSWYLVSHRDLGFDFISLDFEILGRLLPYIPDHSTTTLSGLTWGYISAGANFRKGNERCGYVTRTSRDTRATSETLRAVLAYLIGQWVEDSISQAREPGTVISVTRDNLEQLWGVCLSQRSFRRRSDEPGWVRIDLQGVYDVGGSWKANILGKWLDTPMFQVIVPADTHVGQAIIRRAMLQSLNQELTVDVRETPSEPATVLGVETRPGLLDLVNPCRPGLGGGEEEMNSLFLTLNSVPISSLRHDEL